MEMYPCRRGVSVLVWGLICARLRKTPDPAKTVARPFRDQLYRAENLWSRCMTSVFCTQ
jgi:hypothetical protein